MPKTSEMRESKFLKKEDVGEGALMTIRSCEQYNVAASGAPPEHKWCLTFDEAEKPLVLNVTNIQLCEAIFGNDDTDQWIGKKIVLYTDHTIMYAGKVVGGIRVRQQRLKAVAAPVAVARPAAAAAALTDDDIPF